MFATARPQGELFYFAGLWRPWTGDRGTKKAPEVRDWELFSFLTTEPNGIVGAVHAKAMPVLLIGQEAIEQWLDGTTAEALESQKPVPDDAVELLPT